MTASTIIGIALALFALIFVISAVWWWAFKRFEFVNVVLRYSTIIMLTLMALLLELYSLLAFEIEAKDILNKSVVIWYDDTGNLQKIVI